MFLDESHPPVFQLLAFVENKRDEPSRARACSESKMLGSNAALALMHMALCCEHTAPLM
jgi:hypothetical protein